MNCGIPNMSFCETVRRLGRATVSGIGLLLEWVDQQDRDPARLTAEEWGICCDAARAWLKAGSPSDSWTASRAIDGGTFAKCNRGMVSLCRRGGASVQEIAPACILLPGGDSPKPQQQQIARLTRAMPPTARNSRLLCR